MTQFTRRSFLKTGLTAGALAVSGPMALAAPRRSATDVVTLGRSGVKVTMAFTFGFTRSTCAMKAFATSVAETFRSRIIFASRRAGIQHRSMDLPT